MFAQRLGAQYDLELTPDSREQTRYANSVRLSLDCGLDASARIVLELSGYRALPLRAARLNVGRFYPK